MHKVLITKILICIGLGQLQSQEGYPENFEFLDHTQVESFSSLTKIYNGDLFYVSHNATSPSVVVSKINLEKEVDTIFTLPTGTGSAQSELISINDSMFHIVLHSLADYDVSIPGLVAINVDQETITIDTITSNLTFENGVLGERYYLLVSDALRDNQGNWISISHDSIYALNRHGITSFDKPSQFNIDESFNIADGRAITMDFDADANMVNFRSFENGTFELVSSFPSEERLESLLHNNSGNYFQVEKEIIQLSTDLDTLLNSWSFASDRSTITKLKSQDGELFLSRSTMDDFNIYSLGAHSENTLIYTSSHTADERYDDFHRLTDEQFLLGGRYSLANISINNYFRNVNIMDNSSVNYPRVNVALSDISVMETGRDTFDVNVNNNGDTIYSQQYSYDLEFTVSNPTNEDYEQVSIYGSNHPFILPGLRWLHYSNRHLELAAQASDDIDTSVLSFWAPRKEMAIVVPGANFMFNEHPDRVISTDITSSTSNLSIFHPLLVYPNPTIDFILLQIEEPIRQVNIYDAQGQLVYYSTRNERIINVAELPAGMYTIILANQNSNQRQAGIFSKQ